ncbi:MAG: DUF5615 family PIN-like protein [bacterium]
MKFLLDQNISPKVAKTLTSWGHDVLDTRSLAIEARKR